MIVLLFIIAYLAAGGYVCYYVKANAGDTFVDFCNDDYSTAVAIVTGVLWPVASPFVIAIMFAKKKRGN